ncbi:PepSY domain-containing protein [Candidatus Woesearchaeota archaeon]|nr:PepSY domain-containing protein [Candidatus Woesearchaeota archaeon]
MSKVKNKIKRLKKYHKWPGLIISLILIYYAVSGILMNHRSLFSGTDINRNLLPKDFQYKNWNLAALKGNQTISKDSILVYGNIGVWLTDSSMLNFSDFNSGFPKGIDNRKIFDVHLSKNNNLYAGTLFGLYNYNFELSKWQKIPLNIEIERFVSIISKGDTLIAMNRSYVFKGLDEGLNTKFEKIQLKAPKNYKNKVGLFETMWQIHSGEVFGLPGKLFVDFIGLLIISLSITGIIYFFFPKLIKRRKRKEKSTQNLAQSIKWSLKWHNKIGAWFIVFLVLLCLTGMFLRPPLLIPISSVNIPAIKFTHLDRPNPWYDDLRDIIYDDEKDSYILAGYNGLYELKTLNSIPRLFQSQPPVSVMGINVFEKYDRNTYIIGSFSGLFLWSPQSLLVYDYISGKPYQGNSFGKPFGSIAISGMIKDYNNNLHFVDYGNGILPLNRSVRFPEMPDNIIENSPMSLWSLSLEIHTGRIFHFLLGNFYILIVPLTGIVSIIVILSGYFLWRRKKKRKK